MAPLRPRKPYTSVRWGTGVLGMQREPGSSPSLVEQSRVEPVRLLRTREDGRERVREEARKAGRVERAEREIARSPVPHVEALAKKPYHVRPRVASRYM